MGYATVMNVPCVYTYEKAKELHDNTKPIRGRIPAVRPLGNRRDVDTYSMRMNGEDVEFVLYSTPVITYKPNGDVELFTNGYNSVSTHQFMSRILNINASSSRRVSVITLGEGKRYTMNGRDRLTLRLEGRNWYCVAGAQKQFTWNLNRKKATEVRLRYKEFIDYFKAVVNLRTEGFTSKWTDYERMGITLSLAEMNQAFGVEAKTMNDVMRNAGLDNLDQRFKYYLNDTIKQEALEKNERFLTFVRSDQSEDDKHINFYRAGLAFMFHNDFLHHRHEESQVVVKADGLVKKFDTFLLRLHANEVLVKKELPMGAVSSGTYDGWVVESKSV